MNVIETLDNIRDNPKLRKEFEENYDKRIRETLGEII